MNIAVCLKEVLDTRLPFPFPQPAAAVRSDQAVPIRLTNLADRAALEFAFHIKARVSQVGSQRDVNVDSIAAVSVCTADEEGALVYALARGVDHVQRIAPWSQPTAPVSTAMALARRFASGEFDLVCCGDETMDNASAVVGPLLAELLGWAQVTSVCEVRELSRERCVLVRKLERGHREVVEVDMPVVITFVADAIQPRYVSRRLLDRARQASIPVLSMPLSSPEHQHAVAGALPFWPSVEKLLVPRARVKKRFAPDANLSAGDRVKAIMAGGSHTQTSASSILEGDAGYLVEQLYRFLKHHEFVQSTREQTP